MQAVVLISPHKESSPLLCSHRTCFPKMLGSCGWLASFRFIAYDWKPVFAQCSSQQECQKWSICRGLKGHTCAMSHSCFLGNSAQGQEPRHAQEWSGLPADEEHEVTTSTRSSSYQLLQGDPILLFWAGRCSSTAAHKDWNTSLQKGIFHKEMRSVQIQMTNSHITPLYPLVSVGIMLIHRKTASVAMSCSCQKAGMWTSQAQEEEKCYWNPGQPSTFRVSAWQHKSRWL